MSKVADWVLVVVAAMGLAAAWWALAAPLGEGSPVEVARGFVAEGSSSENPVGRRASGIAPERDLFQSLQDRRALHSIGDDGQETIQTPSPFEFDLVGQVGDAPFTAVIRDRSGAERSRLVQVGDTVNGYMIVAMARDTLVAAAPGDTILLTLLRGTL